MTEKKPGLGGEHYLPYENREGKESIVYFTRDLSAFGLKKVYARINDVLSGKIAVKLHTGEQHGPNIIPRSWVRELFNSDSKFENVAIVETNTYYEGNRYTTDKHLETLKVNGWTFAPVDIMDAEGTVMLPVEGGKWFSEMSMGKNILNYDSFLALTHFKGHAMGGFGGSNKNIGIGCADGRIGKAMIHTGSTGQQWGIGQEEFMERMSESTKATIDHFKNKIAYINVMRNMSVSCDCEGVGAEPVVTPNVGILASLDINAIDTACVDILYAMKDDEKQALKERIESRHGLRQLTYMQELGMGSMLYKLIDLDNEEKVIKAQDAAIGLKPFEDDHQQ